VMNLLKLAHKHNLLAAKAKAVGDMITYKREHGLALRLINQQRGINAGNKPDAPLAIVGVLDSIGGALLAGGAYIGKTVSDVAGGAADIIATPLKSLGIYAFVGVVVYAIFKK